jgi:pimeloyl-ACP methyl ester carboxylesterase
VFDKIRFGSIADRSQLYKDLAGGPFFGANRPGAKVSQGMTDSFWLQGMQAGHKNTLDCIKAFSETDFTEDLKKLDVPTLILHGDDDQIVPIGAAALRSSKLVKNATLKIYASAPHGLAASPPRTKTSLTQICWHSLRREVALSAPPGWWRRYSGPHRSAVQQALAPDGPQAARR